MGAKRISKLLKDSRVYVWTLGDSWRISRSRLGLSTMVWSFRKAGEPVLNTYCNKFFRFQYLKMCKGFQDKHHLWRQYSFRHLVALAQPSDCPAVAEKCPPDGASIVRKWPTWQNSGLYSIVGRKQSCCTKVCKGIGALDKEISRSSTWEGQTSS